MPKARPVVVERVPLGVSASALLAAPCSLSAHLILDDATRDRSQTERNPRTLRTLMEAHKRFWRSPRPLCAGGRIVVVDKVESPIMQHTS